MPTGLSFEEVHQDDSKTLNQICLDNDRAGSFYNRVKINIRSGGNILAQSIAKRRAVFNKLFAS